MTKNSYLKELERYLKRLPKEDYQEAIEYFEEYFDEVGPEGEQEAISELGSPKEAAHDILTQLLDKQPKLTSPKTLWIALLALLASPITLPLVLFITLVLITVGAIFIGVLITVIHLIIAFSFAGITMGVAFLGESLIDLSFSIPSLLFGLGVSLMSLAIGILLVILLVVVFKFGIKLLIIFVKWIGKKVNRHA